MPLKCNSTEALRSPPGAGEGQGWALLPAGSGPVGEKGFGVGGVPRLCRLFGGGCEESAPTWGGCSLSRGAGHPPALLLPPSNCAGGRALSWCAPGAGHGECVAGLLRLELGERLGLQLPGGGPRLPARGLPGCPPRVSMPSEFSSISWMRGGIEPGISIFSVITRSAPAG